MTGRTKTGDSWERHGAVVVLVAAILVVPSVRAFARSFAFSAPDGPCLAGAWDVEIDGDGNIYVTSSWGHQVVKLNPAGEEMLRFGSSGTEPAQFHSPNGIALDADGNCYVTDEGTQRVLCNEPYFGGVTLAWQNFIVDTIVESEKRLPRRHLISQNITNKKAKVRNPHPAVSTHVETSARPSSIGSSGMRWAMSRASADASRSASK